MALRAVESGRLPPSTRISLRAAAPLLLRTATIDEFRQLYDRLFSDYPVAVRGPGIDEYGRAALTVTATASKLLSIDMDRNWAERTDAAFIAQDIVTCCEQVRVVQPRPIADAYLEAKRTSELASMVVEHERYLLQHS